MYYRERAQDGRRFADFPLPDFSASTPKGDAIRSRDLRGDPVVLAFLAVHCRHSMRTLPILQELVRTRGDRGLRVVGVWVNSGSVEDLNTWLHVFEPEFEVWSYPSASLGDVVQSHLVPTILFVDRDGKVREKMVGEKTLEDISARADALLAS
jgi:peroxiredoxin